MRLFDPANSEQSGEHKRLFAIYEVWYTVVDFLAAFLFLVGSVLFFWKSTETIAIWMFVVGSFFFALKPTIRLARELHYMALGDYSFLAQRDKG
ncbi:YrhK family protein [Pararhizobium mangrovi]|uniref:YrhK domain-containing protein n=1 Tax=Pararhizobium mangrovi TaxID=2590452 RepID=A0A506U4V2_9HYPH|nr:YrhK family protein [Pararhizobium mangrovi]TPW27579.1 hypothetical protein FJU11_11365 [Pararhizobium mangrovi]